MESKFIQRTAGADDMLGLGARLELHEVMRCALEGVGRRGIGVVEEEDHPQRFRDVCCALSQHRTDLVNWISVNFMCTLLDTSKEFSIASQIPL